MIGWIYGGREGAVTERNFGQVDEIAPDLREMGKWNEEKKISSFAPLALPKQCNLHTGCFSK